MKTKTETKWKSCLTAASLVCLVISSAAINGCGGATGAPPIPIPAPTSSSITVTAPNVDGMSLVYGTLTVASTSISKDLSQKNISLKSTPLTNTDVRVTNADTGVYADTTTDGSAFFQVEIAAELNDTIEVKYKDAATATYSQPASIEVTNETQKFPTAGMVPQDMDVDTDSGFAYVVSNDGTDSEIDEIDLATGQINNTLSFTNVLYDKIAVYSTGDYAAVLDSTNSTVNWCDLSAGTCSSNAVIAIPNDVAVVELAATPVTTGDFLIVAHAWDSGTMSTYTIYPISSGTPPTLGTLSRQCIPSTSDPNPAYGTCSSGITPTPTQSTFVNMTFDANNNPRLATIVEYSDGSQDIHFGRFTDSGTQIILSPLAAQYKSANISTAITPFDLMWYSATEALLTDTTAGNLVSYDDSTGTMVEDSLSIGTTPQGIYTDDDNTRAFVAEQGTDTIINVDMTSFALSGTTYLANYNPTHIVYYTDGTTDYLGILLTSPDNLFRSPNITP